jgi:hypothetical protein
MHWCGPRAFGDSIISNKSHEDSQIRLVEQLIAIFDRFSSIIPSPFALLV